MLEGERGVARIRQGPEDLVELALCRALMACLGVPDDEHHGQVNAATRVWNWAAMPTTIHASVAAMTSTAACGRIP
jgi:hypothetical protein